MVDKCLQCRTWEAMQTQRRLDGLPPQFGAVQPLKTRLVIRRIPTEPIPRTVGPKLAPANFDR